MMDYSTIILWDGIYRFEDLNNHRVAFCRLLPFPSEQVQKAPQPGVSSKQPHTPRYAWQDLPNSCHEGRLTKEPSLANREHMPAATGRYSCMPSSPVMQAG